MGTSQQHQKWVAVVIRISEEKIKQQTEMSHHIAAFLKNGGVIYKCRHGEGVEFDARKRYRNYNLKGDKS